MIKTLKKIYKNNTSYNQRILIKYKIRSFIAYFYFFDLNKIASIHRTDKNRGHFYTQHYHHHFKSFRFKKINFLEIGVGGYDNEIIGGHSLRMWKTYFPFAKIFSIDIFDKSKLEEKRIKIFKGSQIDKEFLNLLIDTTGELDLIVDDGSHINSHVIETFKILFSKLKIGGYYVIEDTQTSYWEEYGGTSEEFNKDGTIYKYFKDKVDCLNAEEFIIKNYKKTYYDNYIVSMHFYHNIIFIKKGENNERSNKVRNNQFF